MITKRQSVVTIWLIPSWAFPMHGAYSTSQRLVTALCANDRSLHDMRMPFAIHPSQPAAQITCRALAKTENTVAA